MKRIFILTLMICLAISCSKENNNQSDRPIDLGSFKVLKFNSIQSLEKKLDSKIKLKGKLTGKKFSHRIFYSPPYTKIAHFDLDDSEKLSKLSKHIVIYFHKNADTDVMYKKFLDKECIIYGTLKKVDGAFLNVDLKDIETRKAHTIYFITADKIKE